ncbi:MAG: exo-alpha-sialidase [Fuerstiella sp.]|jgi:predicted neuraminidase|nr:exo-alpha-sialidase [Fuerstiella sp.]
MRARFLPLPGLYLILLTMCSVELFLGGSGIPADLKFAASEFAFTTPPETVPEYQVSFVQPVGGAPSVHAGTITQLNDCQLLAAWFGGAREGAKDVNIYCSRSLNPSQGWTVPTIIASRKQTTTDLNRYIKKLGNPILFADSNGRVWLFYVTVSVGGWSGSSITVRYSDDHGETWSTANRLVTSPFLNVSTLVKGSPAQCESGYLLLPVYHEFVRKFGEVLTIDSNGQVVNKTRLTALGGAIQPWLVPLDEQRSRAFYRNSGGTSHATLSNELPNVFAAECEAIEATNIPNPDSAVAVVRRHNGGFLMVCNPTSVGRHKLSLAVSTDGQNWKLIHDIEDSTPPDEFSYPYLIKGDSGDYHLIYTWKRTKMRHVVFNEQWLGDQL